MRLVRHWNRLARKVSQFPSLEVFMAQLVETLCNLINLTGEPEPALASNLADMSVILAIFLTSSFAFFLLKELGKRP